jgi:hypothetical protein
MNRQRHRDGLPGYRSFRAVGDSRFPVGRLASTEPGPSRRRTPLLSRRAGHTRRPQSTAGRRSPQMRPRGRLQQIVVHPHLCWHHRRLQPRPMAAFSSRRLGPFPQRRRSRRDPTAYFGSSLSESQRKPACGPASGSPYAKGMVVLTHGSDPVVFHGPIRRDIPIRQCPGNSGFISGWRFVSRMQPISAGGCTTSA